nr:MAG TPA: hypothetical protein [Caudoviricetes sp.]
MSICLFTIFEKVFRGTNEHKYIYISVSLSVSVSVSGFFGFRNNRSLLRFYSNI